jgi:hypothetical protein
MGEALYWVLKLATLQIDEEEGGDMVCSYLIILGVILLVLYVALYIYNKVIVGKRVKQHPCKFCGHMVNAVSQCCAAPVEEKFMAAKCSKCGKPTRTVCATCKRDLY